MALFHKNKKLSDLPSSPKPDFDSDFDDDFPKYTSGLGNIDMDKPPMMSPMPKVSKIPIGNMSEEKKTPKQVFVKIEKYEEAMDHATSIKNKIKDIEKLFDDLRNLKRDEDENLEKWQDTLNQIKDKLSMIDKNLFEQ